MKIDKGLGSVPGLGVGETGSRAGKAAKKAGGAAPSDTVSLSSTAANVQGLVASAGTGEVFDAGNVSAIKQAISEGKFQVNPEKVADKLIQSVQEMIQARVSKAG